MRKKSRRPAFLKRKSRTSLYSAKCMYLNQYITFCLLSYQKEYILKFCIEIDSLCYNSINEKKFPRFAADAGTVQGGTGCAGLDGADSLRKRKENQAESLDVFKSFIHQS
jgi:hypothetical protein